MRLAQLSVNRPVTTAMIFIAMVVLGLVSMSLLGLDLMPDIEIPACNHCNDIYCDGGFGSCVDVASGT